MQSFFDFLVKNHPLLQGHKKKGLVNVIFDDAAFLWRVVLRGLRQEAVWMNAGRGKT